MTPFIQLSKYRRSSSEQKQTPVYIEVDVPALRKPKQQNWGNKLWECEVVDRKSGFVKLHHQLTTSGFQPERTTQHELLRRFPVRRWSLHLKGGGPHCFATLRRR